MRRDVPPIVASALALGLIGCLGARTQAAPGAPFTERHSMPDVILYDRSAEDYAKATYDLTKLSGLFAAEQVSSVRVLGDSQTAGFNLPGYDENSDTGVVVYSGGEGVSKEVSTQVRNWPNLFREYAARHGVRDFVNAGVSGWRMQYLADEPDAWLGDGADVIVVMLGTNDAVHFPIDEFRDYAERALTACAERCEHLVVVCPPYNERTDATNRYGMEEIEGVLHDLSDSHGWEYVSLLHALEVGTDDFQEDEVHPTESGSEKLWQAFRSGLSLPA